MHQLSPFNYVSVSGQAVNSTWIGLLNPQHHSVTGVIDAANFDGILSWHDGTVFRKPGAWFQKVSVDGGHYCMQIRANGEVNSLTCNDQLDYICQLDCNDIARKFW